ncbi:MAG: signal peptidase [Thermoleophilaceae bacterium]|nr:signal peptidase [Thermoleophilaceae bacterium]
MSVGPGPEAPAAPEPGRPPRRLRWLVVLGFVLAVVAMVLGLLIALAPLAIGVVLLTSGRQRAGIALIVTTVVLVAVPRFLFVVVFDGRPFRIPSGAMEPTLKIGDRILTVGDDSPERGDLFVFHPPRGALNFGGGTCGVRRDPGQACPRPTLGATDLFFVKRVVGLPGDRLKVVHNRVVVDGRALAEPYIRTSPCTRLCNLPKEIVVPPGHYFMVGDNRGESDDSRDWGPVPKDSLVGRAVFRYLPLRRFGSL